MRTLGILISAAIAAAIPATAAEAALYTFNLTGSRTASFTLDSTKPSSFTTLQSQFSNVAGTYSGVPGMADVSFGIVPTVSAVDVVNMTLGFSQFSGPQLFTGPTSNPVFNIGTFALSSIVAGNSTLTIAAAPVGGVPEPASWALMLTGFALVGGTMRRRAAISTAARSQSGI